MENNEQVTETNEAVQTEQTQEVTETNEAKTFTQEQLNSIVANRVAKERDIITQELGIGEKYSKDSFNSFIENTKKASDELTSVQEQINDYKNQVETITTQKTEVEQQLMFNTFNVNDEFQEEFLTLVNSKISDEVGLMEAAKAVSEKFNGTTFTKSTPQKEVVIGKGKSSVKEVDLQKAEMERLRNL